MSIDLGYNQRRSVERRGVRQRRIESGCGVDGRGEPHAEPARDGYKIPIIKHDIDARRLSYALKIGFVALLYSADWQVR